MNPVERDLQLFLKMRLSATHSLEERDTPHEHCWRIEVGMRGPLKDGRIGSLPDLREILEPSVQKLSGTFLNENPLLNAETRRYPTCENLALYFEEAFGQRLASAGLSNIVLSQIQVSVEELDGEETGSARLVIPPPRPFS